MALSNLGQKPQKTVLVVGAGPVGLLTALRLAQANIAVQVMEKASKMDENPRAVGYFGGALIPLERAGILTQMEEQGFSGSGICWRGPLQEDRDGLKRLGDIIARLPFHHYAGSSARRQALLYLPQPELAKILFDKAVETGLVTVNFNSALHSIDCNEDSVQATFQTSEGKFIVKHGDFLVGADGGKSQTRKLLGIPFKGHSWPERIVAIDFMFSTDQTDPDFPTSLIIHPVNYGLLTPLKQYCPAEQTLYRCSVAVDENEQKSDEELCSKESLLTLLDRMLPGPRPLQVEGIRGSAYRTHQLCASTFRRGRCLLAGDAAHLNNPWGAMGLTTGLLDAEALADALDLIVNEDKSLDVLDLYSDERSEVFQFFVDPLTRNNKLRATADPDRATDDWFLRAMKNPTPEFLERYGKPFIDVWRTDIREKVLERRM